MAFTPLNSHFDLGRVQPEAMPLEYFRPGYTGLVAKNRVITPVKVIIQTGECLPTQMSDLLSNEGDATVTVNVNALNLGVFNNCYKYSAAPDTSGVPGHNADGAGTNGRVRYRIEWHQLTP